MYDYYRKLNSIFMKTTPDDKLKFIILKEQSQSLLSVINSLNLVNEKSRYLMIKQENDIDELNTNVNNIYNFSFYSIYIIIIIIF